MVVLVVDGGWRCFQSDITSHARRNPELCPALSCSAVHLGTCGKTNRLRASTIYHSTTETSTYSKLVVEHSHTIHSILYTPCDDCDTPSLLPDLANDGINNRRSRSEHRRQDATTFKERKAQPTTQYYRRFKCRRRGNRHHLPSRVRQNPHSTQLASRRRPEDPIPSVRQAMVRRMHDFDHWK